MAIFIWRLTHIILLHPFFISPDLPLGGISLKLACFLDLHIAWLFSQWGGALSWMMSSGCKDWCGDGKVWRSRNGAVRKDDSKIWMYRWRWNKELISRGTWDRYGSCAGSRCNIPAASWGVVLKGHLEGNQKKPRKEPPKSGKRKKVSKKNPTPTWSGGA